MTYLLVIFYLVQFAQAMPLSSFPFLKGYVAERSEESPFAHFGFFEPQTALRYSAQDLQGLDILNDWVVNNKSLTKSSRMVFGHFINSSVEGRTPLPSRESAIRESILKMMVDAPWVHHNYLDVFSGRLKIAWHLTAAETGIPPQKLFEVLDLFLNREPEDVLVGLLNRKLDQRMLDGVKDRVFQKFYSHVLVFSPLMAKKIHYQLIGRYRQLQQFNLERKQNYNSSVAYQPALKKVFGYEHLDEALSFGFRREEDFNMIVERYFNTIKKLEEFQSRLAWVSASSFDLTLKTYILDVLTQLRSELLTLPARLSFIESRSNQNPQNVSWFLIQPNKQKTGFDSLAEWARYLNVRQCNKLLE